MTIYSVLLLCDKAMRVLCNNQVGVASLCVSWNWSFPCVGSLLNFFLSFSLLQNKNQLWTAVTLVCCRTSLLSLLLVCVYNVCVYYSVCVYTVCVCVTIWHVSWCLRTTFRSWILLSALGPAAGTLVLRQAKCSYPLNYLSGSTACISNTSHY